MSVDDQDNYQIDLLSELLDVIAKSKREFNSKSKKKISNQKVFFSVMVTMTIKKLLSD